MDDKYYYRIKSLALELQYLAQEVKDHPKGLQGLVASEKKREEIRGLLAVSHASVEAIQSTLGTIFVPEFRNNDDVR